MTDGVWLLLRLRRTPDYPNERDWRASYDKWIADLNGLMDDFKLGGTDKTTVAAALKPSFDEKKPTLYDRYRLLRTTIASDGAITASEVRSWDTDLVKVLGLRSMR